MYNYHLVFEWGNLLVKVPISYLNSDFRHGIFKMKKDWEMSKRIQQIKDGTSPKTWREYKDFEEGIYYQILSGILGRKTKWD